MPSKCLCRIGLIVTLFTAIEGSAFYRHVYDSGRDTNATLLRPKRHDESCTLNEHECKDGVCVRPNAACNGFYDCADGSDEAFSLCRKNTCHPGFRCNYGACINWGLLCNGRRDCVDNSDELLPKCSRKSPIVDGKFKCASGQLIPEKGRCDGVADCKDDSDERVAACAGLLCRGDQFQCEYGGCVDGAAKCNGVSLLQLTGVSLLTVFIWSLDL